MVDVLPHKYIEVHCHTTQLCKQYDNAMLDLIIHYYCCVQLTTGYVDTIE